MWFLADARNDQPRSVLVVREFYDMVGKISELETRDAIAAEILEQLTARSSIFHCSIAAQFKHIYNYIYK